MVHHRDPLVRLSRSYFDDFARRIRTLAQSLSSSLDLAAATMAALRSSRGLAQVLLRIGIELLFALGAAEVISLPFMLGSSSGGSRFYVHATDRIFHSCCAIHYDLPLGSVSRLAIDVRIV